MSKFQQTSSSSIPGIQVFHCVWFVGGKSAVVNEERFEELPTGSRRMVLFQLGREKVARARRIAKRHGARAAARWIDSNAVQTPHTLGHRLRYLNQRDMAGSIAADKAATNARVERMLAELRASRPQATA